MREELKDFDYKLIKIQGENYSEVFENAVKIISEKTAGTVRKCFTA